MVSQLKTPLRAPVLRLAPELFAAELSGWLHYGARPKDALLLAILENDLQRTFALGPTSWPLIHATLVWLFNFAPPLSYGSAAAVAAWVCRGGLYGGSMQ